MLIMFGTINEVADNEQNTVEKIEKSEYKIFAKSFASNIAAIIIPKSKYLANHTLTSKLSILSLR